MTVTMTMNDPFFHFTAITNYHNPVPSRIKTTTTTTTTMMGLRLMSGKYKSLLATAVCLYATIVLVVLPFYNNGQQMRRSTTTSLDIVGFWHIGGSRYAGEVDRDDFVRMQAKEILGTYLFSEESQHNVKLNYVTRLDLSDETKTILRDTHVIYELPPTALPDMKDDEEYYEYSTLAELHSFCLKPENEDTVVFYIHSKTNDGARQAMEEYLLGSECAECMQDENKVAW